MWVTDDACLLDDLFDDGDYKIIELMFTCILHHVLVNFIASHNDIQTKNKCCNKKKEYLNFVYNISTSMFIQLCQCVNKVVVKKQTLLNRYWLFLTRSIFVMFITLRVVIYTVFFSLE